MSDEDGASEADELRGRVDYVLVDHWKDAYIADVQAIEALGLLHKGSRVAADKILFPGAPEYRRWMEANTRFRSKLVEAPLGLGSIGDAVLVSELL